MSGFKSDARLMIAGAAIFASVLATGTPAEARGGRQHDHQAAAADQGDQTAPAPHDMTAMKEKMMADSRAADATLQPLIEKMNAAKGEAKIDAMAAVIAELVKQRTAMRGQMEQMPEMMGMMMKKMSADMPMMECPMMKDMPASSPKQ